MKVVHTTLREDFGLLDANLVRGELLAEAGIAAVSFEPAQHGLSIEYDPAILSERDLLDIFCRHGVYPEAVPPRADVERSRER
jgi:hypothetical protein